MYFKVSSVLLIILISFSCSNNKAINKGQVDISESAYNSYFPGVDSTVARSANQFSDRITVDLDRRKQAEIHYNKGNYSFEIADSILNISSQKRKGNSNGLILYRKWIDRYHINSQAFKDDESFNAVNVCLTILDTAYTQAVHAKLLNPFDLNIRSLLIKIYLKQGELTSDTIYYKHAIEELNNFLLVDKSNPYIYEKLAECFHVLKSWEKSYEFFHQAAQILKIVSKFKFEKEDRKTSPIDTTRLVYYLMKQGETKAKLYDSANAIYYLTEAEKLSNSNITKQELQNVLSWINWDDGNIRASEIKDEILADEKEGNYKKARGEYLELLKMLKTRKANNEITWKIASIEFNYLDRKKEALKRLYQVISQVKNSSQVHQLDTVYSKDYAAMCYAVGMEYLNDNKFRLAYIYLNQAAQFDWEHKGDCFYQLALLSRENPEETIRNCTRALNYSLQLSENFKENIYEMLAISYKRKGEFDTANRYFQNLADREFIKKNN